jgi:hypothetical protein
VQFREGSSSEHIFVLSTDGRVSAALRNDWSEPRGGRDGEVPAQAADVPSSDGARIEVHHSCTTRAVVNGGRVHRGPTAFTAAICTGQCALGSSKLGLDDTTGALRTRCCRNGDGILGDRASPLRDRGRTSRSLASPHYRLRSHSRRRAVRQATGPHDGQHALVTAQGAATTRKEADRGRD